MAGASGFLERASNDIVHYLYDAESLETYNLKIDEHLGNQVKKLRFTKISQSWYISTLFNMSVEFLKGSYIISGYNDFQKQLLPFSTILRVVLFTAVSYNVF